MNFNEEKIYFLINSICISTHEKNFQLNFFCIEDV